MTRSGSKWKAENASEQLREPERRITPNLKSTSTAAARLRSSFGVTEPAVPQWILVESGAPSVVEELPTIRPSRLAVVSRFWEDEHAFSADGHYAFDVPEPPTLNWLQIAAAHVFYNPYENLNGTWKRTGPFSRDALIALVEGGLERDDDIIQQWFDGGDVLRLLRAAGGFDEIVLAADAINGGHEVRTTTREYVDRVLGPSP